ncbi:hypothetical protein CPB84DRAFT_1771953 [Gymnopilus junonius]|uniref:Uncharacterized protein n=1 Tax=Gymnopilus junonius TaxID=109634 RepID=A0A9P5NV62_GYMJU|nr:hypothetical protein CPB84DRAFT_1771953 [Gymnopilus junonius]
MSATTPISGSSSASASFRVIASPQKHEGLKSPPPSQSQSQPQPHSPSTTTAPPAAPSRSSIAIQDGADALMELLESEKSHLTKLYHQAIRQIETSVNTAHAADRARFQATERRTKTQEKSIEILNSKLRGARARASEAERELENLRKEHEALKEAVGRVGLVWTRPVNLNPYPNPKSVAAAKDEAGVEAIDVDVDENENESGEAGTGVGIGIGHGTLEFTDRTKRIVNDFMRGARMQQKALTSSRLGSNVPSLEFEDERLSKPVGPTEFFDVLSGVMERGRKFAGELEKQRRRERALAQIQTRALAEAADSGDTSTRDSSISSEQQPIRHKPNPTAHQSPSLRLHPQSAASASSKILDIFTYQLNQYTKLTEPPPPPRPSIKLTIPPLKPNSNSNSKPKRPPSPTNVAAPPAKQHKAT